MGCKRILLSNDWYPALQQPNVELVTDGIAEVARTLDRHRRRHASTRSTRSIFGTGFHVTDMPIADMVRGRDGRTLAEAWNGTPEAYRGTTVAGFPNLFMLIGPNTGLGHTSVVLMIESQIELRARRAARHGRSAARASSRCAPRRRRPTTPTCSGSCEGTVWTSGGCTSWYLDDQGRDTVQWPGATWRFRRLMEQFDEGGYEMALPSRRRPRNARRPRSEAGPSR